MYNTLQGLFTELYTHDFFLSGMTCHSPTPVVSLLLIPRIQYHPGIPVTLSREVILRYTISDVVKNFLPRNPLLDFCPKRFPFSFWWPRTPDVSCVAMVGKADLHFYFASR